MKNTIGRSVTLTLYGESHGPGVGAVLDGLSPGIPVDTEAMDRALRRRSGEAALSTARRETDEVVLQSGVYRGRTTGTPLALFIANRDTHSADYAALSERPRPGHGDYPGQCKYHGFQDPRGGGHFSGRITAALVAAGEIARTALRQRGVRVATHVLRCGGVADRTFLPDPADPAGLSPADMTALETALFPVLDTTAAAAMRAAIAAARETGDSVGGVLETVVTGLPAGLGEPWFDSVESVLAQGMFAVPAVKGVAFGDGFDLAERRGSEVSDGFRTDRNGRIVTRENHNGGIGGGITNGMPLRMTCCVKPTASIALPQETVNLRTGAAETLTVGGRHDPAIVHRAAPVADAMTAILLCDLLALRYGTDYLGPEVEV